MSRCLFTLVFQKFLARLFLPRLQFPQYFFSRRLQAAANRPYRANQSLQKLERRRVQDRATRRFETTHFLNQRASTKVCTTPFTFTPRTAPSLSA